MVPATVARHVKRAVVLALDALARVPGRLLDAGRDRRAEAQDDRRRRLVGDDVPCPSQGRLDAVALRQLEGPRRQRHVADPLDLEGPQGVAGLVPADQVEGVRLQRRLDEVRTDDGLSGR